MESVYSTLMKRVIGRVEKGRWLQTILADPCSGAVELIELREQGGRFNPPQSFPMTYMIEDRKPSRNVIRRWVRASSDSDSRFVTLVVEIQLTKVVDLCDEAVRKTLGLSLAVLASTEDMSLTQSIGVAAHRAEFEGIVYPRALGKGARNLGLFSDRVSAQEISIVGAADLES